MNRKTFAEKWTWAVLESDLNPTLKMVAVVMGLYADHWTGANCRPGAELVASMTTYDVSTVKRSRRKLVELGWLRVTHQGGSKKGSTRSTSCYQLTYPTSVSQTPIEARTGGTRPPVKRASTGGTRPPVLGAQTPSTGGTVPPHHQQTRAGAARSAPGGASRRPAEGTECECDGVGVLPVDDPCPRCQRTTRERAEAIIRDLLEDNWSATVGDASSAIRDQLFDELSADGFAERMRALFPWMVGASLSDPASVLLPTDTTTTRQEETRPNA